MKVIIFGHKGFLGNYFLNTFNFALGICQIELLEETILLDADVLINCAGASNVSDSLLDPVNDFHKNVLLVNQLLEKIRLSGNSHLKFINLSSAAVYGNPQILPIPENSLAIPISPYGFHKKIAEEICLEYSKCFGMQTLSLRIFSAYGRGQKKMLLWDINQKILNSTGKITMFGSGEESRDFIHIDDILRQVVLAINNADFKGEVINVGNGKETKIKDIVHLYKKHHPVSFEYNFNGENRPGYPLNWCGDISKMKQWGYQQKVSIIEGVRDYIKWVETL